MKMMSALINPNGKDPKTESTGSANTSTTSAPTALSASLPLTSLLADTVFAVESADFTLSSRRSPIVGPAAESVVSALAELFFVSPPTNCLNG